MDAAALLLLQHITFQMPLAARQLLRLAAKDVLRHHGLQGLPELQAFVDVTLSSLALPLPAGAAMVSSCIQVLLAPHVHSRDEQDDQNRTVCMGTLKLVCSLEMAASACKDKTV